MKKCSKLYYDRMRWKGKKLYWCLPQYKIVKWKRYCKKVFSLKPIYYLVRMIYEYYKIKYNIDIPARVNIGAGFRIEHIGGIVVNPSTIIGNNVSLYNGVTLGAQNRGKKKGTPTIVLGNPGKLYYNEKATEGYLINKIAEI